MVTYGFRIRFLLPEDSAIDHDEETLDIPLPLGDQALTLRSVSKATIRDSRNLTIRGSGLSSEDEAGACGRRAKRALLLCGARRGIGFDVGKDQAPFVIIKGLEPYEREKGVRVLPDVHGLSVFPEDKPPEFPSAGLSAITLESPTRFVEEFGKAYDMSREFTPKQSLALELYGASKFESSLRARFLTLIIAVECLSTQEDQPRHVLDHVKELMDLTRNSFEGPEKASILSHLGQLKNESHRQSCRELVTTHLGPEAANLFDKCYKARGDIVHDGSPREGFDLGHYVEELDRLVSRVLIADVASVGSSQEEG